DTSAQLPTTQSISRHRVVSAIVWVVSPSAGQAVPAGPTAETLYRDCGLPQGASVTSFSPNPLRHSPAATSTFRGDVVAAWLTWPAVPRAGGVVVGGAEAEGGTTGTTGDAGVVVVPVIVVVAAAVGAARSWVASSVPPPPAVASSAAIPIPS